MRGRRSGMGAVGRRGMHRVRYAKLLCRITCSADGMQQHSTEWASERQ